MVKPALPTLDKLIKSIGKTHTDTERVYQRSCHSIYSADYECLALTLVGLTLLKLEASTKMYFILHLDSTSAVLETHWNPQEFVPLSQVTLLSYYP